MNFASLATIESKEELHFLQTKVPEYLMRDKALFYDQIHFSEHSTEVYIGLQRNTKTSAQRFQWVLKYPTRYHPLILNHWQPSEPSGGFKYGCGAWVFEDFFHSSSDDILGNTSTKRMSYLWDTPGQTDGWRSVGCGTLLTKVSLCEVTLPRPLEDEDFITIRPASPDKFRKAANRSEFREFERNIVSVSLFVRNEIFRKFLKNKNEDFPMFYCGDDASEPRYISFSHTCDYIDHCSNGRDESVCSFEICSFCRSGRCVPDYSVCDGYNDCEDGSDEENCNVCIGRHCCDGTCLPLHMFNDGEVDCSDCEDFHDESGILQNYNSRNESCAFICNKNECIYPSQLNDGKKDCLGLEGPLDETLGKLERASSCTNLLGQTMWAPRCVYIKDRFGHILGCRDLSHLQNCTDFQCQEGYYKCPGSYCIPQHYVLDRSSDCPVGEEENEIAVLPCEGNFACWDSKVCLHPDLVCDGHPDCPHKDDEMNCNVECAEGFRCIAGTVIHQTYNKSNIREYSFDVFIYNDNTRYLDMSGMPLNAIEILNVGRYLLYARASNCELNTFHNFRFEFFNNLDIYYLDFSNNLLTSFNYSTYYQLHIFNRLLELNLSLNRDLVILPTLRFHNLENLDLSYTGLSYLENYYFEELYALKYLNLSHTKLFTFPSVQLNNLETVDLSCSELVYLKSEVFKGLNSLKQINLSHTKLSTLEVNMFASRFSLDILDLRGSPVATYSDTTFEGLTIKSFLYTDNFGLCCPQIRGSGIPGQVCQAPEDAISSCFDLIGVEVQRILLWVVAVIALVGNVIVIVYRLLWDRAVLKKAYGLFVTNLGVSDLIMGLYLLIIAGADVWYRGMYVLYDREWKASIVCKIAGFLATFSSETSTFFIFLITLDRFLALRFPYGEVKFSTMSTIIVILLVWITGFVLGIVITIPFFASESMASYSAMCLLLPFTNKRQHGWIYSVTVFIVLNFIMFLVIAFGQIAIFRAMSANRMSKEATNQNLSRRAQDITVAKQLSLVVLSDFVCWFPVGVMGLLSLRDHEISNDIYAWTVILVIPINSAVNPLLYTIPVVKAKWKIFKEVSSKT